MDTPIIKKCKACGAEFDARGHGRQCYCTDQCRRKAYEARGKELQRLNYLRTKKKLPKRMIPCKRCGAIFHSIWNQAYCPKCIMDPYDQTMQKYRYQRTRDPMK